MAVELLFSLLRAALGLSLGLAVVLLLRPLWMRIFGARAARGLWLIVPLAAAAATLPPEWLASRTPAASLPVLSVEVPAWVPMRPTGSGDLRGPALEATPPSLEPTPNAWPALASVWALGAALLALQALLGQRRAIRALGRLRRRSGAVFVSPRSDAAPLAYGLLRPRVVLPSDFRQRYSAPQRALVLAHERSHIEAGDLPVLALAIALRSIFWFNPLVHIALPRLRFDLEAACDARVLDRNPRARADYARALLNTQLADSGLPVGCAWRSGHPLLRRIQMLNKRNPSRFTPWLGTGLFCALSIGVGGVAWAAGATEFRAVGLHAAGTTAALAAGGAVAPATLPAAGASTGPITSAGAAAPAPAAPTPATATANPSRAPLPPVSFAAPTLAMAAVSPAPAAAERMAAPAAPVEPRAMAPSVQRAPTAPSLPRPFSNDTVAPPVPVLQFSADQRRHAPNPRRMRADGARTEREISLPVLIEASAPAQPRRRSFAGRRGGEVLLEIDIDAEGAVLESRIAENPLGPGYGFEARKAVQSWRFQPALLDGRPVSSTALVPVPFNPSPQWDDRLHEDASPALLGAARPGTARPIGDRLVRARNGG